jgi:integrase/recombinase XerD
MRLKIENRHFKKETFINDCCIYNIMGYSKEWLTEEELHKMLSLPDLEEKYEIWILLLYSSGLRVSEAINIRVRDLIVEKQRIHVIGGKKRATNDIAPVPCNLTVIRQIKRYCDRYDLKPSDFVMFTNKGKQADRSWVYKKLNDLCHQAGIEKKIGTHTMRRSRATHLLGKGITIDKVSKYLRHKSISTTMVYLNITIDDLQKALDQFGDPMDDILRMG